jgi:hypothetical protein
MLYFQIQHLKLGEEDENGPKAEDTVWDVNNNEKISKFVNQYQTDIKSLMT